MQSLAERYKPRSWDDVIGQPKAVALFKRLIAAGGVGGRAYWLSGKSGQGKTSIVDLAAASLADEWHTYHTTGREMTVATVREWSRDAAFACPWAFIVNEAHGLGRASIELLLDVIDTGRIPSNVAWFFTTTKAGQERLFDDQIDAHPLLGRCMQVELQCQGWNQVAAAQGQKVAIENSLDGQPLPKYVRLANECNGSLREIYQRIEAGEMLA